MPFISMSFDLLQNKNLQSTRKPTCQFSNTQQSPKDAPIGYGVNLECAVFEIDPGMEYFTALLKKRSGTKSWKSLLHTLQIVHDPKLPN